MAANCPFCSGTVTEELARLGGNCPHCFNPIPGEEAATDPGVEAQQAEAEASRVEERNQTGGRMAILIVLLLGSVGFGGWFYWQQLQEEEKIAEILMEDDDVEFFFMDAEQIESMTAEEQAAAEAQAAADAKANKPVVVRQPKEDAGSFGNGDDRFTDNGATDAGGSGSGDGPTLTTTSMGPASLSTGPGIGISRKDLVLTDPTEIQQMAGTAIKRYSGQIKTCYETELKGNESLSGSWTLTFTINPDGSTSNAVAKANNASDAGLEACMKRQVANWSFQKIAKAQPVGKTYRFGAR
ncbi:MAG: hypothetical protein ACI9VR_000616 [Cognaticolwellia sp.]|jgi:hypothetical protein